jgi:hypothetical protein
MAKKEYKLANTGKGIDISKLKVRRQVTLPLWKWADGVEKYFEVMSPIRKGKAVSTTKSKDGVEDGVVMKPADLMTVRNLETGVECELIVGAVLKSTMIESYDGETYVGRMFSATQTKIEGKRYRAYSLNELES